MTTVIFVHGTSVREPAFTDTFKIVEKRLKDKLPDLDVVPCSWGDSLGAKLHADGASIPLYDETNNANNEEVEEEIIRWHQLHEDPLYELRLLSVKDIGDVPFQIGQESKEEELRRKVESFTPSAKLEEKFAESGLEGFFQESLENVRNSNVYDSAMGTIGDTSTEYRDAIARAVVAEMISLIDQEEKFLPILTDVDLRDEIVKDISIEINDTEMGGVGDWLKDKGLKVSAALGTFFLKRNRGSATDASYPIIGDILLYQSRGQELRNFIQTYIDDADSSVVLIGHSLGGIACFDLLAMQPQEKVKLLVTVGSQAPFFYEIGALTSLDIRKNEKLPKLFPSWLNIYDLRDILSYVGGSLFMDKVQDILVDNRQSFPKSHGAYWTNSATWKAIVRRIREIEAEVLGND